VAAVSAAAESARAVVVAVAADVASRAGKFSFGVGFSSNFEEAGRACRGKSPVGGAACLHKNCEQRIRE